MTKQEMIDKVNAKIKEKYSKLIVELNKDLVYTPEVDGTIESPGFSITPGGGNLIEGKSEVQLVAPARLQVGLVKKPVVEPIYRIEIPFHDIQYGLESNESYLESLLDFVFNQAINNYNFTFGGPKKVRYGTAYLFLPQVEDYRDDFLITFKGYFAKD